MATASVPRDPDLEQLCNQARDFQRAVRNAEPSRVHWFGCPSGTLNRRPPERFPLTAAQLVFAREHGFASWARLRRYVEIVSARA